jgi:hypothetical protein
VVNSWKDELVQSRGKNPGDRAEPYIYQSRMYMVEVWKERGKLEYVEKMISEHLRYVFEANSAEIRTRKEFFPERHM